MKIPAQHFSFDLAHCRGIFILGGTCTVLYSWGGGGGGVKFFYSWGGGGGGREVVLYHGEGLGGKFIGLGGGGSFPCAPPPP